MMSFLERVSTSKLKEMLRETLSAGNLKEMLEMTYDKTVAKDVLRKVLVKAKEREAQKREEMATEDLVSELEPELEELVRLAEDSGLDSSSMMSFLERVNMDQLKKILRETLSAGNLTEMLEMTQNKIVAKDVLRKVLVKAKEREAQKREEMATEDLVSEDDAVGETALQDFFGKMIKLNNRIGQLENSYAVAQKQKDFEKTNEKEQFEQQHAQVKERLLGDIEELMSSLVTIRKIEESEIENQDAQTATDTEQTRRTEKILSKTVRSLRSRVVRLETGAMRKAIAKGNKRTTRVAPSFSERVANAVANAKEEFTDELHQTDPTLTTERDRQETQSVESNSSSEEGLQSLFSSKEDLQSLTEILKALGEGHDPRNPSRKRIHVPAVEEHKRTVIGKEKSDTRRIFKIETAMEQDDETSDEWSDLSLFDDTEEVTTEEESSIESEDDELQNHEWLSDEKVRRPSRTREIFQPERVPRGKSQDVSSTVQSDQEIVPRKRLKLESVEDDLRSQAKKRTDKEGTAMNTEERNLLDHSEDSEVEDMEVSRIAMRTEDARTPEHEPEFQGVPEAVEPETTQGNTESSDVILHSPLAPPTSPVSTFVSQEGEQTDKIAEGLTEPVEKRILREGLQTSEGDQGTEAVQKYEQTAVHEDEVVDSNADALCGNDQTHGLEDGVDVGSEQQETTSPDLHPPGEETDETNKGETDELDKESEHSTDANEDKKPSQMEQRSTQSRRIGRIDWRKLFRIKEPKARLKPLLGISEEPRHIRTLDVFHTEGKSLHDAKTEKSQDRAKNKKEENRKETAVEREALQAPAEKVTESSGKEPEQSHKEPRKETKARTGFKAGPRKMPRHVRRLSEDVQSVRKMCFIMSETWLKDWLKPGDTDSSKDFKQPTVRLRVLQKGEGRPRRLLERSRSGEKHTDQKQLVLAG